MESPAIQKFSLNNKSFKQYLDIDKTQILLKSSNVSNTDKLILTKLLSLVDTEGLLDCKYFESEFKIGRLNHTTSIFDLSRTVRQYLCKDYYYDFDIKKSQPNVFLALSKKHGISTEYLEQLCYYDTEKILQIIDVCNIDDDMVNKHEKYSTRDIAKELINGLMNGGRLESWLQKYSIILDEDRDESFFEFWRGFEYEMITRINKFKKIYNTLYTQIIKKNEVENKTNNIGSFLAFLYQEFEKQIIQCALHFDFDSKDELPILIECRDGFMMPKKYFEGSSIDEFIQGLHKNIITQLGSEFSSVKICVKPQDEPIDPIVINGCPKTSDSYATWKFWFELTHFKIIKTGIFYLEKDNELTTLDKKTLRDGNQHYKFTVIEETTDKKGNQIEKIKTKSFIEEWLNDPDMRTYEDVVVQPNIKLCPKKYYNLWRPFTGELIKQYNENLEGLQFILNHIKILCNHEQAIYDYFMNWLAHLIQKPWEKCGVCPVFISLEGIGKGQMIRLIKSIIGNKKFIQTSNPSRDIWGTFNERMATSYLVYLDEIGKKDTAEFDSRIKNYLTESCMEINPKGKTPYEITSYHRFILTTNKDDPVPTSKDDRRFFIIRSSDEKLGDEVYFKTLNNYIENQDIQKTFFEYLKNMNNGDTQFFSLKKPLTEYQKDIQETNISPIELFFKEFCVYNEFKAKESVEMKLTQFFGYFQDFMNKTGYKNYDYTMMSFIKKIKTMKYDEITTKHTKIGNLQYIDLVKLRTRFGFDCIIKDIDDEPKMYEKEL